jgi:hypothetical protein
MTPNQVLNKVIARELHNGIKPREPPSSPTHSALASKQAKMLKSWTSKEAQVKRKKRMQPQAPQAMKKKR